MIKLRHFCLLILCLGFGLICSAQTNTFDCIQFDDLALKVEELEAYDLRESIEAALEPDNFEDSEKTKMRELKTELASLKTDWEKMIGEVSTSQSSLSELLKQAAPDCKKVQSEGTKAETFLLKARQALAKGQEKLRSINTEIPAKKRTKALLNLNKHLDRFNRQQLAAFISLTKLDRACEECQNVLDDLQ